MGYLYCGIEVNGKFLVKFEDVYVLKKKQATGYFVAFLLKSQNSIIFTRNKEFYICYSFHISLFTN